MPKNTQLLKLLTPALKARVLAKTQECLTLAKAHFPDHDFELPEIRYDIKNWVGGLAYRNRNLVRYNLILLVENEDHYIENVIPHEVAHLVNNKTAVLPPGRKRILPHGKEWQAIMRDVFKVKPATKHKYDTSSIERSARRRRGRAERVDTSLRIIEHIVRRAQVKYSPEELHRFNSGLNEIFNGGEIFRQ